MARTVEELNADIKRLSKEIRSARKELRAFGSDAEDAAEDVDKVGRNFKDSKEQLEGFGASLRAVGGDIGPLEDMATALEKLGPAGFAAAAGVAALVAGAMAVAKFAQVTVEATRAAGDLLDEWDRPEVFAEQAVAIDEANRALDGLVFAGQQLQILFAAGMSPAVVEVSRSVAALAIAISDAVEIANDWGLTLERIVDSQIYSSAALRVLSEGVALLNEHYAEQVDQLFNVGESLRDTSDEFDRAADAIGAYLDAADDEFELLRLTDAERARIDEEDRKRRERRAREEQKARDEALKAEEKYWEAWRLESEKAIEAQAQAEQDAAEEAQRLFDEQTAAIQAAAEAEAEAVAAAIEVEKRGREELAKSSIGLADTLLAAVQDNANTETAEGRRTARQVFGARKALARADVAIATIVAVQQALASAPPPFNAIPAAAMGVAGAANLAAVAAQKPPSFAIGGLVPSDHRLIGAQAGEGILSTAAVRALGEEQVGAMNRGTAGGAPVEVAMVYRHRVFDRFVQDNLRRSNSPLAGAIQGARRKRKRRR